MPESGKKKRSSKSRQSGAKSNTNAEPTDSLIGAAGSNGFEEPQNSGAEESIQSGIDVTRPDSPSGPELQEVTAKGSENGAAKVRYDHEIVDQVIAEMVTSVAVDSLADDFADKIGDALTENPEFRQRVVEAMLSNEKSRDRVVRAIISSLD